MPSPVPTTGSSPATALDAARNAAAAAPMTRVHVIMAANLSIRV
jgi:hypothetical protein